MKFLTVVILVLTVVFGLVFYGQKKKRAALMLKYRDEKLVDRLMRGDVWQGETHEQLRDSMGRPLDIDQQVMKTKTKEVWKYRQKAKNQYALRIFLEDGIVVGWDKK